MSAVVETLRIARDAVARPGGWTQWTDARDERGYPCHAQDGVCWCGYGAIWLAADGDMERIAQANMAIYRFAGTTVTDFNDAPDRTQAEVVELFDKVIAAEQAVASNDDEGRTQAEVLAAFDAAIAAEQARAS